MTGRDDIFLQFDSPDGELAVLVSIGQVVFSRLSPATRAELLRTPVIAGQIQPVVDVGLVAYTEEVTAQARKILEEALSLPDDDRQRLVEALLDSIPAETAEELETSWNAEALRRAEAFERGEVQAIDGEKAIDSLRSKLSQARGA